MARTKTRKWWSKRDIAKVNEFIKEHGKTEGLKKAAEHYAVSTMALYGKLWRIKNNVNMSYLNKNKRTTKVPVRRISPVAKRSTIMNTNVLTGRSITLTIKDVSINLNNNTITISY